MEHRVHATKMQAADLTRTDAERKITAARKRLAVADRKFKDYARAPEVTP